MACCFRLTVVLSLAFHFSCDSLDSIFHDALFRQQWENFLGRQDKNPHFFGTEAYLNYQLNFFLDKFTAEQAERQRAYLPGIDRYRMDRPYADNQVTLSDGTHMSASFLHVPEEEKGYHYFIATQAPFEHLIGKFWQMIEEHGVEQIVMLTELQESTADALCHLYWPHTPNKALILNNSLEVSLLEERELLSELKEKIQIRKLHLRHAEKERIITHYWYRNWPDNTAPSHSQTILTLIQVVEADKKSATAPILVHCAAGVGRTGVFVTLYHQMQRVKMGDAKLDLFSFIAYLRWQRPYMVAKNSQYRFCHAVCNSLNCASAASFALDVSK